MSSIQEFLQELLGYQTSFLFIFFRISLFLAMLPLMGGRGIPPIVKVGIALSISFILLPILNIEAHPGGLVSLTVGILGEALIGLVIGLGARVIFAAVELAGEMAGIQMGFGIAHLFDPTSNQQVSLIGQFYSLLATLIFFGAQAHHFVIQAMVHSFGLIPPMGLSLSILPLDHLIRSGGEIFILGIKIAVPVVMALLLANVMLGIFSRVIPQMNVWLMSFAITIALGLLIIGASLPLFAGLVLDRMDGLRGSVLGLLSEMRPP